MNKSYRIASHCQVSFLLVSMMRGDEVLNAIAPRGRVICEIIAMTEMLQCIFFEVFLQERSIKSQSRRKLNGKIIYINIIRILKFDVFQHFARIVAVDNIISENETTQISYLRKVMIS